MDNYERNREWLVHQRRRLPVRAMQEVIIDKANMNQVLFISGETGSGKSSQVPQMLVEAGLFPVLCTQPRRLAVVAVAKRVAEEMGTNLGGEVGYHIGQKHVASPRSKIVFATAGILLERLMANGEKALTQYKAVVLDEVHERSIESDIVLCAMKQLLLRSRQQIKLVLMSATADFRHYEKYFEELGHGSDKMEHVPVPSQLVDNKFECGVQYLDHVIHELGRVPERKTIEDQLMVLDKKKLKDGRREFVTAEVQALVRDFVLRLDEREADRSKVFLVFLPTYRALEEQEELLQQTGRSFRVDALHSSIDIDTCVRAMENADISKRKVILATSIAESSVTISGVSCVVDLCRNLVVEWDSSAACEKPKLEWISHSQGDQRRGRTGRTCDGVVYRLVPGRHYSLLEKFERPSILYQNLRKQILQSVCSSSKATNDPTLLLTRCMDPPDIAKIQGAKQYLVSIGAATVAPPSTRAVPVPLGEPPRNNSMKLVPTKFGQLMVSLPVSLEAAQTVVAAGRLGLLREGAVLAAILDSALYPIVKPFGQPEQFKQNLQQYYANATPDSKFSLLLANLLAFEFWQREYQDRAHLQHHGIELLSDWEMVEDELAKVPSLFPNSTVEINKEMEWCAKHHLVRSALHAVAETVDIIVEMMQKHRPDFITKHCGPPVFLTARGPGANHVCAQEVGDDGLIGLGEELEECGVVPFTTATAYHSNDDIQTLLALMREVKAREETAAKAPQASSSTIFKSPVLCSFYAAGNCMNGANCSYTHATNAPQAPCAYFNTPQGCHHGPWCRFRHDQPPPSAAVNEVSELPKTPPGFEEREPTDANMSQSRYQDITMLFSGLGPAEYVVLLGEGDFSFAHWMVREGVVSPTSVVATSFLGFERVKGIYPSATARLNDLSRRDAYIFDEVDALNLGELITCASKSRKGPKFLDTQTSFIMWNFPYADEDHPERHSRQLSDLFLSVFNTFAANGNKCPRILLTLCSGQFCRWKVERAARKHFFFVGGSWPFDVESFSGYHPVRNLRAEGFGVERPVLYAFDLQLPYHYENRVF